MVSVQVPADVDQAVKQVAGKEMVSRSDVLRRFIREGLDRSGTTPATARRRKAELVQK